MEILKSDSARLGLFLSLVLLTETNNRPIIGIGRLSADADCQMADTDYRQTG